MKNQFSTALALSLLLFAQFVFTLDSAVQGQQATQESLVAVKPTTKIPQTDDFRIIKAKVDQMVEKYGHQRVLVVFDIDNTLLAMNQDLGSDQWYNWQSPKVKAVEKRMKEEKQNEDDLGTSYDPEVVAKTFPGLLKVQRTLFELSGMHPPQKDLPKIVGQIQQKNVRTILLTSRGPVNRSATERELKNNHYNFQHSTFEIQEKRTDFFPFDKERPYQHGLSPSIIAQLGSPRKASFSKGIFMTAGQHKGYMLRTLIARDPNAPDYKAIVFADDHCKHSKNMLTAFKDSGIEIHAFQYTREKPNVDRFEASDKIEVIRQWDALNAQLKEIFQRN